MTNAKCSSPFLRHRLRMLQSTRRTTLSVAVLAALGPLAMGSAQAATCTWNTTNGNWNALANWLNCATGNGNPGGVPGPADSATIGSAGVVAVTNAQTVNALSNAGTVNVASGGNFLLNAGGGGTVNSGTLNVASGGNMYLDGRSFAHAISGGGSIVLDGGALRMEGGQTTTLVAGTTIRGAGTMGQAVLLSGAMNFVNNGTVSADVNAGSLVLTPPANSGSYTNNNLFEARNGATLQLASAVSQGSAGVLQALNGSSVLLNGIAVSGGTVTTAGTGAIRATDSNANLLSNVTLSGLVDLSGAAAQLRVANNLAFSGGTINVGTNSLYLDNRDSAGLAVNQTLSGTGSIALAGGNVRMEAGSPAQTTLASGVIISGWGNVGQAVLLSGQYTLINNGLISANANGNTLVLQPIANAGQAVQNNGILEATGGGILRLDTSVVGGSGSQLRTGVGSTILMNGVTLSGLVNATGSGTVTASNTAANLLSNVTLNGVVDLSGAAAQLRVGNNLSFSSSTIKVGASSWYLDNRDNAGMAANQTLSGTGSITLAGGNIRMEAGSAAQTTISSGVTLSGFGNVGQAVLQSGQYTLINNGLISANSSGNTLLLQPMANGSQAVQNNGILEATGGGILSLSTGVVGAVGSELRTGAGSTILMNGVTLSGVVNATGSGMVTASNNFNNLLSNVTLNGVVDLSGAASQLRVGNNLAFSGGTLKVGTSTLYLDNRDGAGLAANQTLSGTGSITLAGGNIRMEAGSPSQTTIANGVTISGWGNVGQAVIQSGQYAVVNNGTFAANTAGQTLTLQPFANGSQNLSGTGTLQVAGGTLSLATGRPSTQGTLDMGATGTLATNNQNLTLGTDYTSAQWGSGNSFNRRAGITGTGQVLAGGNAAMNITGANITGGATGNATLTINNVRVGGTTFNYQLANVGTTGPTLRGALQTTVNGGNLNDARLSGSGVTAANYNAGSPSNHSGNQGVTFTAAAAGLLAPMSGQVLNLRSNFDNIADQKLNIVLGAGAAAYNAAVGAATPSPLVVTNQRVGGANMAALTVANTAAASAFSEDLRASFGSNSGAATNNGGVVSGLLAGASNSSAMGVRVDSSSAGAKTGTVVLNYDTLGAVNGVSNGLGVAIANAAQTLNVSGNVFQAASGTLVSAPLNFGTVQVGQAVSQNLVIRNSATGTAGFVEDLNASFGVSSGTGAGLISGTGTLSGITAGNNSAAGNGVMTVSVNTSAAGSVNGNIAVNYFSAGSVAGVSNGLGTVGVGSDAFGVQGTIGTLVNVINQASPQINNSLINLGAVRVGAAAPSGIVSVTNVATAAPQAALNASIAPTSGPTTASGSFNLLAPGSTNSSSLTVGMNTGTAGNFTGANAGKATLSFVSDANNVGNCAPNCQLNLASQTVDVAGKVYTPAVGFTATTALNFGIVRVGDTVSARNIVINNTAANTALNDTLRGSVTGLSGPFGGTGSVSGVAAQSSGNLAVSLNTATAGIFSQVGSVGFSSQNADMADVSAAANADVTVSAQVNNLANPVFSLFSGSGSLSRSGSTFFLDYGALSLGDTRASSLNLSNLVMGPADSLDGLLDVSDVVAFNPSGWNNFSGLEAGNSLAGLGLNFLATAAGGFERLITLSGRSVNASDPGGVAQSISLVLRGNVLNPNAVPEPGTLSLILLAAGAGWAARRRKTGASPQQA